LGESLFLLTGWSSHTVRRRTIDRNGSRLVKQLAVLSVNCRTGRTRKR